MSATDANRTAAHLAKGSIYKNSEALWSAATCRRFGFATMVMNAFTGGCDRSRPEKAL